MKTTDYKFIKEWVKTNEDIFIMMYPHVSRKNIRKFLKKEAEENISNPNATIHNNYVHKSMKTTLLDVVEWIRNTEPICGGNGVFFRNQHQVTNALAKMILKFLAQRKAFKGQLKFIKDKYSYEYKTFDRKQLSEKIMANSIYGSLGNKNSFIYNEYTAPAVTGSGQSLISTTCTSFEAFMANNVAFNNINECMMFLSNIVNQKHKIDDTFLPNVSIEKVFNRLQGMFYKYDESYEHIILGYLAGVPQNILNRIFYKNNLYKFSLLPEVSSILIRIVRNTKEFKDPNKLPESSKEYLEQLWALYEEFVLYKHFAFNRIQRLKNDTRKSVLTIDTDSNMVNVNPWVEFMKHIIIDPDYYNEGRSEEELRFIAVNTMAYVITNMVSTILAEYCKVVNIPKDYRSYINMKNELLMSFMLLVTKKKKYITSVRLREGDEIYPEKLDIKGFEFIKSSTTEDAQNLFKQILRNRLIDTNEISVSDILRDMEQLELNIFDSLKNGEKTYLTPKSVKEEGGYKDALREQGFRAVYIWNVLYPDMQLDLPTKTDIVKVTLDKQESLNQLKEKHPDIYAKIERYIINNKNPQISEKLVPVIAIPRNIDSIPEWIIPFIDYDTIAVDVVKKFYPVLESLGLEIIKTSDKEYFSNIINI